MIVDKVATMSTEDRILQPDGIKLRKILFNISGGFLGFIMALLFGWLPLFVVMAVMGLTKLSHGWSVLGLGISYAFSIPTAIILFSVLAWQAGMVSGEDR